MMKFREWADMQVKEGIPERDKKIQALEDILLRLGPAQVETMKFVSGLKMAGEVGPSFYKDMRDAFTQFEFGPGGGAPAPAPTPVVAPAPVPVQQPPAPVQDQAPAGESLELPDPNEEEEGEAQSQMQGTAEGECSIQFPIQVNGATFMVSVQVYPVGKSILSLHVGGPGVKVPKKRVTKTAPDLQEKYGKKEKTILDTYNEYKTRNLIIPLFVGLKNPGRAILRYLATDGKCLHTPEEVVGLADRFGHSIEAVKGMMSSLTEKSGHHWDRLQEMGWRILLQGGKIGIAPVTDRQVLEGDKVL